MKVLGLSCSPRNGGNTDILLDEMLRSAQDNLCQVEKLPIAQLNIHPCTHCDHCLEAGSCRLDDDMQLLYPKLLDTDCLILASPIYFMAHCAQAKALIDRCQVFWARRYVHKERLAKPAGPTRRGIFISVGATHGSKVFAGAKITMKWFFDALEIEYWDNLLFEGINTKGAIAKHPTAISQARQLGQKLAQLK